MAPMHDTLSFPFSADTLESQKKFFLPPSAMNLRHATTLRSNQFGECRLFIVGTRRRGGRDHFGLAGFGLN